MNSVVIKFLFVQIVNDLLTDLPKWLISRWFHYAHLTRLRFNEIRSSSFVLKDFVIEQLLGWIDLEEFEDVEVEKSIAEKKVVPSEPVTPIETKEKPTKSIMKYRVQKIIKKLLRTILLPILEEWSSPHEFQKSRKNDVHTNSQTENYFKSDRLNQSP